MIRKDINFHECQLQQLVMNFIEDDTSQSIRRLQRPGTLFRG